MASTWSLGSTQTYNDGSNTLTFSAFETLNGGSAADAFNINADTAADLNGNGGDDSFTFADGVTLTGTLSGGSGNDTLDYSA